MSQDVLDLIEAATGIDQKRCIHVPKIMYPKVGQTGRAPNPFPTFHDRGVGLSGLCIDEHEPRADLEAFQDFQGGVI